MNKFFTKEVRIALMVIAGIILLFVGMNFLKGIIVFSNDNSYKIIMDNINGLAASSPLYADGYKVGVVRDIKYDYQGDQDGIVVTIDVDKNLRIPAGSTAEVDADLMGNLKLNLLLANNMRERIEPGGIIRGSLSSGMMEDVALMLPQIKAMLPKIDSILTSVNNLMADPALAIILKNAAATTENLKTSTAQLNALLGQMDRTVPAMLKKADNTLANTEAVTGNLAQIDIAATMADINATVENCKQMTAKLTLPEGTIGKLLTDPSLYDNMNATMRDADSLMIDLKAHPKRYVHFSVFGKKDK